MKKFESAYRVAIAALASSASVLASTYFGRALPQGTFIQAYVLISVIIVVFVIDTFIQSLIGRYSSLRKLIYKDDFIEGYWHDESFDPITKTWFHGVLFHIDYRDGELSLTGVTYDKVGRRVATFRSDKLVYSDRVLFYEYESHTDYGVSPIEIGIAQLQFDSPAVSYTGFYFSHDGKIKSKIVGEKVSNEDFLKFNRFKQNSDKKSYVCKLLELLENKTPSP